MTISLDCLGKFITYNYVADMEDEVAQTQVMEKVVDGICDCFIGEETDKKVQLQIIKALLDAVYSTSNPLHLSALLKAVRTTYNIFLLSRNNDNQNVAQVTMTQMVYHIFRRVKRYPNEIPRQEEENELKEQQEQQQQQEEEQEQQQQQQNGNKGEENLQNGAEDYQQQIIVEANMARTEMNQKAPSGKSKDNYQDILNDTANMFQEETKDSLVINNTSNAVAASGTSHNGPEKAELNHNEP